jgi:hypothetical protein
MSVPATGIVAVKTRSLSESVVNGDVPFGCRNAKWVPRD